MPQSGFEPKFEPELFRTGPKSNPRFGHSAEPNRKSGSGFGQGGEHLNLAERGSNWTFIIFFEWRTLVVVSSRRIMGNVATWLRQQHPFRYPKMTDLIVTPIEPVSESTTRTMPVVVVVSPMPSRQRLTRNTSRPHNFRLPSRCLHPI